MYSKITSLLIILFLFTAGISFGQLREQQSKSSDYTGNVIKKAPSEGSNLGNLFNMTMNHSYSMTFGSFGGQALNLNAYTNTMHFYFSDRLTGRVDLSLLHSPFGNSFTSNNQSGIDAEFVIQNAELNYQLSEKSNISFHFRQIPSHGFGYGGFSPLHRNSFFDQNY